MKSCRLHVVSHLALMMLLSGAFILALAERSEGQVNSGSRPPPIKTIPPESSSRPLPGTSGAVIVSSDTEAGEPSDHERARSLLAQINEDFSKIQVIHNQMMNLCTNGQPLDYKYISEVTAEIRKRANRLKINLKLPAVSEPSEKDRKYRSATDGPQLKAELYKLDETMMSFVGNPLFQQAQLMDVKLATKALRDLRGIIELSQGISKDAERLSKTAATP